MKKETWRKVSVGLNGRVVEILRWISRHQGKRIGEKAEEYILDGYRKLHQEARNKSVRHRLNTLLREEDEID
jgi:hypothetical protein